MAKEFIFTRMDQAILENGLKMFSMGMGFKSGRMVLLMKGNNLFKFRSYEFGQKNGHGKFTWKNGSYYEGNFINNIIEG